MDPDTFIKFYNDCCIRADGCPKTFWKLITTLANKESINELEIHKYSARSQSSIMESISKSTWLAH